MSVPMFADTWEQKFPVVVYIVPMFLCVPMYILRYTHRRKQSETNARVCVHAYTYENHGNTWEHGNNAEIYSKVLFL